MSQPPPPRGQDPPLPLGMEAVSVDGKRVYVVKEELSAEAVTEVAAWAQLALTRKETEDASKSGIVKEVNDGRSS